MKKFILILLLFISSEIFSQYGIFIKQETASVPITDTSNIAWRNRVNTFTLTNIFTASDTIFSLRSTSGTNRVNATGNYNLFVSASKDILLSDATGNNKMTIFGSLGTTQFYNSGVQNINLTASIVDLMTLGVARLQVRTDSVKATVPLWLLYDRDTSDFGTSATGTVTQTGQSNVTLCNNVSTTTSLTLTVTNALIRTTSVIVATVEITDAGDLTRINAPVINITGASTVVIRCVTATLSNPVWIHYTIFNP